MMRKGMQCALRLLVLFCFVLFCCAAWAGQTVIIDTTVNHEVYGNATGANGEWDGNNASLLDSNNNTVIITSGATVMNSVIYGGYASGTATATNNTVTISGTPNLTGSVIFGGIGVDITGTTLNVWNYEGIGLNSVRYFEVLNFVFPATQPGPVLAMSDEFHTNRGYVVTVSVPGGADPLRRGKTVTLIEAGSITNDPQAQAQGQHGATLLYDWDLANPLGDAIVATLKAVRIAPQAKSFSEGFLGGLVMAARGADLVAGQGMANALRATRASRFGSFAALSGGSSRYDTGSHVDAAGVSLVAGFARGVDAGAGRVTAGAFLEYGVANYDTHNSFSNAASVDGTGDTWNIGGGILGRMDFRESGSGQFYAEASARIGGTHSEFNSGAKDATGRTAGYDNASLYYGTHIGGGYVRKITDKATLDLYGKYFWTRQEGDTVTLTTNDPVTFRDADSHRLRVGARYTRAASDHINPYAGAAYEHEFNGKARASSYGYGISSPSLRGGTAIMEAGMTVSPSRAFPLSLDIGAQGYLGKRRGVSVSARAGWAF